VFKNNRNNKSKTNQTVQEGVWFEVKPTSKNIKIQEPQSLQEFAPRIQDQYFENGHLIN